MKHTYIITIIVLFLSSCVSLPLSSSYTTPPQRPDSLDKYYSRGNSYSGFKEILLENHRNFDTRQYLISSKFGESKVHYYKSKEPSKEVIFIFPVLGGKNIFETYFAEYFARRGIDAAIVHRSNDFKNPDNIDRLEDLFRDNLIRDRIVIDFFEKELKKEKFGSFGISRGGINVSMTAGVDPRLEQNVIVMGGTDLVGLFKNSKQKRIEKYIKLVSEKRHMTKDEFFNFLGSTVVTDPKNLAQYINAKNTLLILSSFDSTVPFKYGMKLRKQIGKPKTIVLAADHYTSLLYTQFVPLLLPSRSICLFPFDYIESESLAFYKKGFRGQSSWWKNLPIKILQAPLNFVAEFFID